MEIWAVVFLGVIALALVVQSVFLVLLARAGFGLGRRVDAIQKQLDQDVRPSIESINRFSLNVGELSDRVVLQGRRVDHVVSDTLDRVEEFSEALRRLSRRPWGPLADVAALVKGVQRGVEVYYKLRGFESRRTAPIRRRRSEEDEHLFI